MQHVTSTRAQRVRHPAATGRFYPANPSALERAVRSYLNQVKETPDLHVRGLAVPHAGYPCSGAVAAYAYRTLLSWEGLYPTVFLLGPAHWRSIQGVGLSTAHTFATPLGHVPVMRGHVDHLLQMGGQYRIADAAHAPEHSLEVQLPFLQVVFTRFQIVPMLIGRDVDPVQVADDLTELLRDEASLVVASSDLSHGHPYDRAMDVDRRLLAAVLAGDLAAASRGEACGLLPILCLMRVAHNFGWAPTLLDYRTSGDTCGDKASVVGYAALVYDDPHG